MVSSSPRDSWRLPSDGSFFKLPVRLTDREGPGRLTNRRPRSRTGVLALCRIRSRRVGGQESQPHAAPVAPQAPLFGQHNSHSTSLILSVISSRRASSTEMSADQP